MRERNFQRGGSCSFAVSCWIRGSFSKSMTCCAASRDSVWLDEDGCSWSDADRVDFVWRGFFGGLVSSGEVVWLVDARLAASARVALMVGTWF